MADRRTGVALLFCSVVMATLSWQLPLGRLGRPGPGFFPLFLALILGGLSLILVFQPTMTKSSEDLPAQSGRKKIIYVLLILLVYAVLFPILGYLISTFLFLLMLKPVLEKKWSFVLTGAIAVTLLSYVFFDILLQAQLPRGIWGP